MTITLRISFKTRLLLLIVALVATVAVTLSLMNLDALVENQTADVLERAQMVAEQIKSTVQTKTDEATRVRFPPPATLAEFKRIWLDTVETDKDLPQTLLKALTSTHMIVEVNIGDEDRRVVVSSNPSRNDHPLPRLQPFSAWQEKGSVGRLMGIIKSRQDYEVSVALGVPQMQRRPVFTTQVIVSLVLLRDAMLPQIEKLALVSAGAVGLSIVLAAFAAKVALRPLKRLSLTIDRIAQGQPSEQADRLTTTREFAIVEDKLNVLGQQYRGAQADASQLRTNIEQLLERLEEAVLLFDRDGRLLMAGSSAERILESDRKAIVGRQLEEIFPASTALGSVIQQAIRLRKPIKDHVVTLEDEGGQPKRLLINVELLTDLPDKADAGVLVTLRDVESRRQLASQLDVSNRLSAISRLTGGVAHEIKNPLNAISLRLELLRTRLEQELPEAEGEITIISSEIRRLDRVVKTFLDFTRPVDLTIDHIDVPALAREVCALVGPQAAQQQVTVEHSSEPESIMVGADRDLLKQAMLNVVMNGIEAMKSGGRLLIEARQEDGCCRLSISDEGPGIPAEFRARVFQLYFTTKERGSGIGLAMTFRAVQLHNGTIEFSSEPGRGTTFTIRLPLEASAIHGTGSPVVVEESATMADGR